MMTWQIIFPYRTYSVSVSSLQVRNICMRRFSRNIRTTKWTDIYETTLAPWLLPTVITANIGKKKSIFRVTDKSAARKNNSAFHYTLPYIAGIALSIIGIVRLVGLSGREQTYRSRCVDLQESVGTAKSESRTETLPAWQAVRSREESRENLSGESVHFSKEKWWCSR